MREEKKLKIPKKELQNTKSKNILLKSCYGCIFFFIQCLAATICSVIFSYVLKVQKYPNFVIGPRRPSGILYFE